MSKKVVLLAVLFAHAWSFVRGRNEFCFGELGCIPQGNCPPPTSPSQPRSIGTEFVFRSVTGRVHRIPSPVTSERLRNSEFDPTRRTILIVHGWWSGVDTAMWMRELRLALLRKDDFNVVLVDWSGGSGMAYSVSAANTRIVGAEVALFVKKLEETFGISPSSVHAYGHSLGSHVVGFAGKWLNGTLGRITALDPAALTFALCTPEGRLARTDAQFVEVIHTSTGNILKAGLGIEQPIGDVDFYPNGGENMPGCELQKAVGRALQSTSLPDVEAMTNIFACKHMRAIDYVLDFIQNSAGNQTCLPIAFACASYDSFVRGHCSDCGFDGSRCAVMTVDGGEHAHKLRGKFRSPVRMYFKTSPKSPFCLFHYQVEMELGSSSSTWQSSAFRGTASIIIYSNRKPFEFDLGQKMSTFTPGKTYRYLVTSERPIGRVEALDFKFVDKSWIFTSNFPLKAIKFTPMTTTSSRKDLEKLSQRFCPTRFSNGIDSGIEYALEEDHC